jgi:Domain of unknown function (DUF397)
VPERGEEDDTRSHVSSFSGGGNCVEVTRLPDGKYVVSHSKMDAPGIVFSGDQWRAFIDGVKAREFDF